MTPAREPRTLREAARMLVLDANAHRFHDAMLSDLPDVLQPGDLLVVNDAATLPASLAARTESGASIEIRLVNHTGGSDWRAVLLGAGDWRTPTELRDLPEPIRVGNVLKIGDGVAVQVIELAPESDRLVTIRFSTPAAAMWTAIYACGRPIQYSYLKKDLRLWAVQTTYASRPWAAEMPSAGLPLTWQILLELRRRGIGTTWLTHAAGISSVGDEELDARLPFPERYEIPQTTVDAIRSCHRTGGRVIAVGTTVVRALEGCVASNGSLQAGPGETDLVIDRRFNRHVVDGILTGVHDPAESHFRLLRAFADEATLRRAWRHAAEEEYLCHEFGDLALVIGSLDIGFDVPHGTTHGSHLDSSDTGMDPSRRDLP